MYFNCRIEFWQVCAILVQNKHVNIGSGVWCGAVFGVTGVYGLYVRQKDRGRDEM